MLVHIFPGKRHSIAGLAELRTELNLCVHQLLGSLLWAQTQTEVFPEEGYNVHPIKCAGSRVRATLEQLSLVVILYTPCRIDVSIFVEGFKAKQYILCDCPLVWEQKPPRKAHHWLDLPCYQGSSEAMSEPRIYQLDDSCSLCGGGHGWRQSAAMQSRGWDFPLHAQTMM